MKYSAFAALAAAALATLSTAVPYKPAQPPAYTPPAVLIGRSRGPNSRVVGRHFEIDGKVQYFAGTNAWWLGYLTDDGEAELAMSEIAKTGYRTVRVWGFFGTSDPDTTDMQVYYQVINETLYEGGLGINYGPNGIHRLDVIVSLAEKYNLQLVLPFLNNWDGLGSVGTYAAAFGTNNTAFYTHAKSQKVYREYIKFIVNRYKHSNAIFAWELGNEPRCKGCDPEVIYNWAKETSEYIKGLDSGHMVTLGDEGWLCPPEGDGSYAYDCSEGVDFVRNLGIDSLDYGTFHLYPESWGYEYSWGSQWVREHDAIGAQFNKPVVFEEYGTPINHTQLERPWQLTMLNDTQLASDSIWQFGASHMPISGTTLDDVNTIYYGSEEYKVLGTGHAEELRTKQV
ncbi:glycoside hydrolase superfamily [Aspergillus varians]